MVPELDRWKVEPFSMIEEEDPNGMVFLSDLPPQFHKRMEKDIYRARQQLEAWQPMEDWSWQQFDA